jgi:hypothetical protein
MSMNLLAWLAIAAFTGAIPQRSGAPLAAATGTATLSGRVVIDDAGAAPVRRAVVTINATDKIHGDTVVTDDAGRFAFREMPAGRYVLAAARPGFVTVRFGATGPQRPGTPIAVADGQQVTDVVLKMMRGAVVSGTIRMPSGEPAVTAQVVVHRIVKIAGQRRLENEWENATTDDRGAYRIFGLAPGEYLVQARVPWSRHGGGDTERTSAADVLWARQRISDPSGQAAGRDAPTTAGSSFASTYYPGTTNQLDASALVLAAGEDRAAVDFMLRLVPTSRVGGSVLGPDGGAPGASVQIWMAPIGPSGEFDFDAIREAAGREFLFRGLPPGRYSILAYESPGGPPHSGGFAAAGGVGAEVASPVSGESKGLWAAAELTLDGSDRTGIILQLQPGLTITGQIVAESATAKPGDLSTAEVRLWPKRQGVSIAPEPAKVNADGTFTVAALVPGPYTLSVSMPPGSVAGQSWLVRSALRRGEDVADQVFEIRPGDGQTPLTVTMSDRPATLTGLLQDSSGRPAPDYHVVVFPADRRYWIEGTRRVVSVRPGSDGRFTAERLPGGDYLIAALTDVQPGEWRDPAFLEQLVPAAIKVILREGEKTVQDIKIGG